MAFGFSMPSLAQRLQSLSGQQAADPNAAASASFVANSTGLSPPPVAATTPVPSSQAAANPLNALGHDIMNTVRGFSSSPAPTAYAGPDINYGPAGNADVNAYTASPSPSPSPSAGPSNSADDRAAKVAHVVRILSNFFGA